MVVAGGTRRSLLESDEYRVDGRAKVTGQTQFTGDFSRPGMLWAAFTASPVPHARIRSVDTRAARRIPGVRAVLTGADIPDRFLGRVLMDWPVLAHENVLFVGQYVAAVAADTRAIAEAAAAAVVVEYDELPALFDTAAALADDAVILHDDRSRYVFLPGTAPVHPHKNIQGRIVVERGDVDAGLRTAARVFTHRFSTPRHHGGYIETHATLVWIGDDAIVHVISTSKQPYALRRQLAACTGVPEERIVVEQSAIGGDFGAKGFSLDDFPCYFLAQATGRPVKSVRSYMDDVRSTTTRHASEITLTSGVDERGNLVALRLRVVYDGGAFAAGKPVAHLLPGSFLAKTPYRIPDAHAELLAVYTNTVPAGHVRSPGDLQIVFALESHIDMIATELGRDPLAFRRQNAIVGDEPDIDGLIYIEPRGTEILEILQREGAWDEPLPPGRGKGIALTAHHIGHGSAQVRMVLDTAGAISIHTPMMDQGVGAITLLQRTAAQTLGLGTAWFTVVQETTTSGLAELGPGATRVTAVTGRAVADAAEQLRRHLTAYGWDGRETTFPQVARQACAGGRFEAVGTFTHERRPGVPESYNFSGFLVDVTVDDRTGEVRINDVLYVADVGTVINPLAHQGQIDGGFVFGLGHALSEELIVEDGRILNLTFADYKIPVAKDLPPFRTILLPTAGGPGPFGAKAIGESSTSAIAPAIANAVARACGARITSLPITSARVFAALHGGGKELSPP